MGADLQPNCLPDPGPLPGPSPQAEEEYPDATLVELRDYSVAFAGVPVIHALNLRISRGEAIGLVGESGSGKSVTWLGALGLLPPVASVSGQVLLQGENLLNAVAERLARIRGGRIGLIFQDPVSALNPIHRVGTQVAEALHVHRDLSGVAARAEAKRLFDHVGIPDAARRLDLYPHELSGGQNQRVMIAMALAGRTADRRRAHHRAGTTNSRHKSSICWIGCAATPGWHWC